MISNIDQTFLPKYTLLHITYHIMCIVHFSDVMLEPKGIKREHESAKFGKIHKTSRVNLIKCYQLAAIFLTFGLVHTLAVA